VAAISRDTAGILRHFAERKGADYPLLADPDSEAIRAFGILNESVPEDHEFYGIPHPGQYLIDENGVVQAKFFETDYTERFTAGRVLVTEFGADAGAARREHRTGHLTLVSSASNDTAYPGQRLALALEVLLPPKMHVYAPEVEGYIPIEWNIDEAEGLKVFSADYPEGEMLHLPAINEIVPVYEERVRLLRDVVLPGRKQIGNLVNEDGDLVIRGTFRYQACDERICYLPKTVPLEWTLRYEALDTERVPEELRGGDSQ